MEERYKFQKLRVYKKSIEYLELLYKLVNELPSSEKYNLSSQLIRAGTSIVLNIAEGSTGQSDQEQIRFLQYSLRSYLETIACIDIIELREYISNKEIGLIRKVGHELFISLNAFKKSLK